MKLKLLEIIRNEVLGKEEIPSIIKPGTEIKGKWLNKLEDSYRYAGSYLVKKYKKGLHGFNIIEFDSLDKYYYQGGFIEWYYRSDRQNGMDIHLRGDELFEAIESDDFDSDDPNSRYIFKYFKLLVKVTKYENGKSKKIENLVFKLPVSADMKVMADIIMEAVEPVLVKYSPK